MAARLEKRSAQSRPGPAAASPPVPAWWSAGVGAAFAALYLALAPPVSGPKDAAEFTLVLAFGGPAHPSGYPLYVLLGHPFAVVLHALGASWAYAANAWSATGGGVAMALLHALAARVVPPRLAIGRFARFSLAAVATAVFAFNPVWLLDAILAETYTWHLVWVGTASLFTLGAIRALGDRTAAVDPRRIAVLGGALAGLGLAHHLTAVLVLAPLALALVVALVRAGKWRTSLLLIGLLAASAPLLSYGFIAWRAFHPAAWQWELLQPSWRSVLDHVRGSAYGDLLGRFAPDEVQSELLRTYGWPVLFPGLALSVLAVALARGADRLALGAFAAAALLQTWYAFHYGVRDPSCYFQPAMALGAVALAAVAAPGLASIRGRGAALAGGALAAIAIAALARFGLPYARSLREGAIEVDRRMRAMWAAIPAGPAFVLWDHDMVSTFQIYQRLEHQRPEIFAGSPATISWPGPRRAFASRFGFDPLAGLVPLTLAKAQRIPENISRQTPFPVMVFDLEHRRLVPVPKP